MTSDETPDIRKRGGLATITDVARLAGVSIKTVSRVMNAAPNVTPATQDKVKAAALALNYEPNQSARVLAGSRSYSIGLVYENPHEFSYLKHVLDGAFEVCGELGYSLLLKPCRSEDANLVSVVRQFVAQTRVDGIILPPPLGDVDALTRYLEEQAIPYAQIAPREDQQGAIVVRSADEVASRQMTGHLLDLGHKRLGFIKGDPRHGASELRFEGYVQALREAGLDYDESLVREGQFDFDSGARAGESLLALTQAPSAIIASNDDMAAGVIFVARQQGLQVPEDLSVVGFDDTPTAAHIWPPLTTVKQPISEMTALAVASLIGQVRGDEPMPHGLFDCELIVRGSTCAPR
jgi:LacI family transcriptional regulator